MMRTRSDTAKPDAHPAPTPADWRLGTTTLWRHSSITSTDTKRSTKLGGGWPTKRQEEALQQQGRQDTSDKRTGPWTKKAVQSHHSATKIAPPQRDIAAPQRHQTEQHSTTNNKQEQSATPPELRHHHATNTGPPTDNITAQERKPTPNTTHSTNTESLVMNDTGIIWV
jgi:hypothetical protein